MDPRRGASIELPPWAVKQFELDERELFKVYPEGFKLKQWYILNLIVREDWRGRGIGSALLKRVSEEVSSRLGSTCARR